MTSNSTQTGVLADFLVAKQQPSAAIIYSSLPKKGEIGSYPPRQICAGMLYEAQPRARKRLLVAAPGIFPHLRLHLRVLEAGRVRRQLDLSILQMFK